ncbi:MAG: DUF1365 domain-containing protein [Halofilum sp. (in: g-proteobacteria)]
MTVHALYTGHVRHRRFQPQAHAFRYRVCLLYLDLAQLEQAFADRWLWSLDRRNVVAFHRGDYLPGHAGELDTAARELITARTGCRPAGPIRLLTHPRYFGYVFNPVSFYYCFDAADRHVESIIVEITNTPWGERHTYVLSADGAGDSHHRFHFAKAFHVSPFLHMDYEYDWRFGEPGGRLNVHMRNERAGRCEFDATLTLTRQPLAGPALARALIAYPLMTTRVTAAIYWQALRLWWRGTPFHTHPRKRTCGATDSSYEDSRR